MKVQAWTEENSSRTFVVPGGVFTVVKGEVVVFAVLNNWQEALAFMQAIDDRIKKTP